VTVKPGYPYSEPQGPNTVDGCADGQSGDFLQAEAVNAITVEATDGGYLKRGESVNITANVYAYDTATRYDFYLSGNPGNNANWGDVIATRGPNGSVFPPGREDTVTAQVILKDTSEQAVRVIARWSGEGGNTRATECPTGSFTDTDDLAFDVAASTGIDDSSPGGTTGGSKLFPVNIIEEPLELSVFDCDNMTPERCAALAPGLCPDGCGSP